MKVKVVLVKGKYLVLRWKCPQTGRNRERSAKTNVRREAQRQAARLEDELATGNFADPCNMKWQEFREAFFELRGPNLKSGTVTCYESTFNRFETLVEPFKMVQIGTVEIMRFQNKLREIGNSESTIAKHLRHLKAALRWAKEMEFIIKVPKFTFPKMGKHQRLMKGRPLTDTEVARFIASINDVVGAESAKTWETLTKGILLSGLRLSEAMALTWDQSESIYVDMNACKFPMFRIRREAEKGGQDRLLPMTQGFSKLLDELPSDTKFVFNVGRVKNGRKLASRCSTEWASIVGSRIGEAAGIVVSDVGRKTKFASFHDLRRTFGDRWAKKVTPESLMKLMRHQSLSTTFRYYVGQEADAIAEEIWHADGE